MIVAGSDVLVNFGCRFTDWSLKEIVFLTDLWFLGFRLNLSLLILDIRRL